MKRAKRVGISTMWTLLIYFGFVFTTWDWNPSYWTTVTRGMAAVLGVIGGLALYVCLDWIDVDEEKLRTLKKARKPPEHYDVHLALSVKAALMLGDKKKVMTSRELYTALSEVDWTLELGDRKKYQALSTALFNSVKSKYLMRTLVLEGWELTEYAYGLPEWFDDEGHVKEEYI